MKHTTALLALATALLAAETRAQAHIRCQNTIGGPCGDSSRPREMNCCDYGYCQPWNSGYYQCLAKPAKCPTQETDIDYAGNDLAKPLYGLSPDQCCDACAASVDCKAYTFVNQNPDGKTACYLKSSTAGRVEKKGAVSGLVLQAPANCPTQEVGVDYYGNDIKAVEGLTQGQCCDECGKTAECKAYSWVERGEDGNTRCYLKRSDAGRKSAAGVISGKLPTTAPPLPPPTTTPPPPPPPLKCPNQELNVDYYGNDIKTVVGVNNAECCDECAKTSGCAAYTFVPENPNGKTACYLKTKVSGKTSKPGAVSALLQSTPPPQPPVNCPDQEWNIDYYGNDIKTVFDTTQTACCDECGKTEECVAYTFVPQNYDTKAACYLKRSTGGRREKLGAVSGTYKSTPSPPPPPGNCPTQEADVDYYGNDIKAVYRVTNAQCCDECAKTSGCTAYTFVAVNTDGKSACYLKSSSAGKVAKAGVVSAQLKCPTPLMGQCGSSTTGSLCCPAGAFCQPWNPGYYQCVPVPDTAKCPKVVDGVDFYGGDLEVQYGLLPGSCCEACFKNKDCVVFTFVNYNDDGRSACYLKNKLVEQRANPRAVSGYKIKQ